MERRTFLTLSLTGILAGTTADKAFATTWFPKDFTCPNCKTKNTFNVIGSYGTYIYAWPSKFQSIYWPVTDENVLYSCKKCFLTLLMWDFEEFPQDKLADVQKQLVGVKIEGTYKSYTNIPMSVRLEVAEKIYLVLNQTDEFWCRFYRIKGYHYDAEKNQPKADEARKQALALATKMLNDPKNKEPQKMLWLISGGMKHFMRDDEGALADLKKALATKFSDPTLDKEKNENGEQNLNALLKEYIEKINGPQKPRLMKG